MAVRRRRRRRSGGGCSKEGVVVVMGLLHVGGDEVVELPLVEEVLQLPADVEVWVQVLAVVVEVVQVLLPEHGPVASQEPQVAPAWDPHKRGSISGQDEVEGAEEVDGAEANLNGRAGSRTSFPLLLLWNTTKQANRHVRGLTWPKNIDVDVELCV